MQPNRRHWKFARFPQSHLVSRTNLRKNLGGHEGNFVLVRHALRSLLIVLDRDAIVHSYLLLRPSSGRQLLIMLP